MPNHVTTVCTVTGDPNERSAMDRRNPARAWCTVKIAYWEIRNLDEEHVCQRGTQRECWDLLEKYVTDPPSYKGWSRGPYSIWRVTETRRWTYRPPPATHASGPPTDEKGAPAPQAGEASHDRSAPKP